MGKSIIKNYIYNFGYQVLVIILPLITTPYVSRIFGAEGIGIYSYTGSISQYFILFGALGLNLYGQREIAYNQNDREKYTRSFAEITILKAGCLFVSMIIYIGMALAYTRYTTVFLIRIIDIVAAVVDISWFFQGLEEFKKIVIRNFIVKNTGVALIFIFVREPSDLYLYVLCYSATLLLGNLSMWLYLPKLLARKALAGIDIRRHLKPALFMFIPQISISIYTLLDKTMIGILTGNDGEVGYYEQSEKIIKLLLTIITSLGTVMMPRIASVFSQKNTELIQKYMKGTFRFVLILSMPICFGIMAASEHFVPWFFGQGFDKVVPNMMIIAPIIIFIGMSNVMGVQYLLPTQRQKEYTISVITGSCVNFCMNLILIPLFKSLGAAIATVVAELTVAAVQMYYVRKDFNLREIMKMAMKYMAFSLCMFALLYAEGLFLPDGVITTGIQTGTGILLYVALIVVFDRAAIREIFDRRKKGQENVGN